MPVVREVVNSILPLARQWHSLETPEPLGNSVLEWRKGLLYPAERLVEHFTNPHDGVMRDLRLNLNGQYAVFSPSVETIYLLPRERYNSRESFYHVLAHELTHAAEMYQNRGIFEEQNTGQAELTAVFGALGMLEKLGIRNQEQTKIGVRMTGAWFRKGYPFDLDSCILNAESSVALLSREVGL